MHLEARTRRSLAEAVAFLLLPTLLDMRLDEHKTLRLSFYGRIASTSSNLVATSKYPLEYFFSHSQVFTVKLYRVELDGIVSSAQRERVCRFLRAALPGLRRTV